MPRVMNGGRGGYRCVLWLSDDGGCQNVKVKGVGQLLVVVLPTSITVTVCVCLAGQESRCLSSHSLPDMWMLADVGYGCVQ